MNINSYKDLIVWQKSMLLVKHIYELTENFPRSEIYGLISQLRRAAVSMPSNIAEGKMRGTRKDYRHFLLNALGSAAELETQLEISKQLPFGRNLNFLNVDNLLIENIKMLKSLIQKLNIAA